MSLETKVWTIMGAPGYNRHAAADNLDMVIGAAENRVGLRQHGLGIIHGLPEKFLTSI